MVNLKSVEGENDLTVEVSGRIGGEAAIDWYRQMKHIVDDLSKKELVLDLSGVDYIDSSGLGALVAINTTMLKNSKSLVIKDAPDNLKALLKITNLDRVLNIQ